MFCKMTLCLICLFIHLSSRHVTSHFPFVFISRSRVVKERLGVPPKVIIGYQSHADTATKSGSTTKNKFVAWGVHTHAPLWFPFLHFVGCRLFVFSFECSRRKPRACWNSWSEDASRFHVVCLAVQQSLLFIGETVENVALFFCWWENEKLRCVFDVVLTLLCLCSCSPWFFFFFCFPFLQRLQIVTKKNKTKTLPSSQYSFFVCNTPG